MTLQTVGRRAERRSARIATMALWRAWIRALRRRDGTARVIFPHLIETGWSVVRLGPGGGR